MVSPIDRTDFLHAFSMLVVLRTSKELDTSLYTYHQTYYSHMTLMYKIELTELGNLEILLPCILTSICCTELHF
jgi:hypothetical protein